MKKKKEFRGVLEKVSREEAKVQSIEKKQETRLAFFSWAGLRRNFNLLKREILFKFGLKSSAKNLLVCDPKQTKIVRLVPDNQSLCY